jgi:hypothetical protein
METAATAAPLLEATAAEPKNPNSDYLQQIFPVPPVICGRQLKPLSIGRYRTMSRFKVAFVAEGEASASAGDLLLGVLICSMGVDEFIEFAASGQFGKQIRKWGRCIGFYPPKYLSWPIIGRFLKYLKVDQVIEDSDAGFLLRQIRLFEQYIQDSSVCPPYFDESPGDRVSGAHWSQSIEVTLRGDLGWTRDEINEEPLNKAMWDYFKHMENQGMIRLMTEQEIEMTETEMTQEQVDALNKWAEQMKQN